MKLLTLVITNYNGSHYIENTLNSFVYIEALKEKYDIVVVDNCSTDDSFEKIERFAFGKSNVSIHRTDKTRTYLYSKYFGIKNCNSKYIMFLDGDDSLLPNSVLEMILICQKEFDYCLLPFVIISDEEEWNTKRFSCCEVRPPKSFRANLIDNELVSSVSWGRMNNIYNVQFVNENFDFEKYDFVFDTLFAEDSFFNVILCRNKPRVFVYDENYIYVLNNISNRKKYYFRNEHSWIMYKFFLDEFEKFASKEDFYSLVIFQMEKFCFPSEVGDETCLSQLFNSYSKEIELFFGNNSTNPFYKRYILVKERYD